MKKQPLAVALLGIAVLAAFAYWYSRQPRPRQPTPQLAEAPTPAPSASPSPTPDIPDPTPSPTASPAPSPAPTSVPTGIVISGTVTERETGFPLPDVRVSVADEKTTPAFNSVTAAGGEYRLAGIPPRRLVRLLAEREGYVPRLAHADIHLSPGAPVDFALERAGTVLVRVSNFDDEPIAGALIQIEDMTRLLPPAPVPTGNDGTVLLKGISRINPPFIVASISGRDWENASAKPWFGSSMNARLELRIEDPTTIYFGTVKDERARPLGGITVGFARGAEMVSTTTQANGTYKLRARGPVMFRKLCAYGPGWGIQSKTPTRDQLTDRPGPVRVDFVLTKGHSVHGRVIDPDGRGIPGARVELDYGWTVGSSAGVRVAVSNAPPHIVNTTTAGDGSFFLDGLPPEECGIKVSAGGYSTVSGNVVVDLPVEIRMVPAPTLIGRVADAKTNAPIQNFSVVVRRIRTWGDSGANFPRTENSIPFHDPRGRFEIQNLDSAFEYHIVFNAPGYAAKALKNLRPTVDSAGKEVSVRLDAERIATFLFVDAENREPIRDLMAISGVSAVDREHDWVDVGTINHELIGGSVSNSNAQGEIRFAEADPLLTIYASAPGYADLRITPADRPKYADHPHHWTVPVPRASSIAGTVYFDGAPAPGVTIMLKAGSEEAPALRRGTTDGRGRYEFNPAAPGPYLISAQKPPGESGTWYLEKRTSVNPGQSRTVNIGDDLGDSALYGVMMHEGRPAGSGMFMLIPQFDWHYKQLGFVSRADGTYKITGLPNGVYQIRSMTSGMRLRPPDNQIEIKGLTAHDFHSSPRTAK